MPTLLTAGGLTVGAQIVSSTDGAITIQSGPDGSKVNAIVVDATGSVSMPYLASQSFRNRIINGDMRIDQRYNGSTTTTGGYVVDRMAANPGASGTFTMQRSTQAPTGFSYSLGITVTSPCTRLATDYPSIYHGIEGLNCADLGFGTASAKTVTLSFWVRSSVAGTYGGVLGSGDNNRSYGFTYTINSANTWEQKSITIAGDTSGGATAYPVDNTAGLRLKFGLGAGSNYSITAGSWQAATNKVDVTGTVGFAQTTSATFYITGVQLELGSTATPFEQRPYGLELALCQRYYYRIAPLASGYAFCNAAVLGTTQAQGSIPFPVPMRAKPSAIEQSGTAGDYGVYGAAGTTACTSVPTFSSFTTEYQGSLLFTTGATLTAGQAALLRSLGATSYIGWSAEL